LDARQFLDRLCHRHGVGRDFGRKLVPLVEKAMAAKEEKRRRILEMVERSVVEEARRAARDRWGTGYEDWRALRTVASVLHGWEPPGWFDDWTASGPTDGGES